MRTYSGGASLYFEGEAVVSPCGGSVFCFLVWTTPTTMKTVLMCLPSGSRFAFGERQSVLHQIDID